MAINFPSEQFVPVNDYVDVVYENPRDHDRVKFEVKDNCTEVIKWCRKNFGHRGDGWDFYGTTRGYTIEIWSSKLITMYRIWKE